MANPLLCEVTREPLFECECWQKLALGLTEGDALPGHWSEAVQLYTCEQWAARNVYRNKGQVVGEAPYLINVDGLNTVEAPYVVHPSHLLDASFLETEWALRVRHSPYRVVLVLTQKVGGSASKKRLEDDPRWPEAIKRIRDIPTETHRYAPLPITVGREIGVLIGDASRILQGLGLDYDAETAKYAFLQASPENIYCVSPNYRAAAQSAAPAHQARVETFCLLSDDGKSKRAVSKTVLPPDPSYQVREAVKKVDIAHKKWWGNETLSSRTRHNSGRPKQAGRATDIEEYLGSGS